jgi:hypothetical protein
MSIVLLGSTSGSCTLQEQAVAGTTTLTLPTFNGTVGLLVSETAKPSTSGTSIDFTSIPAGVRRITVMFRGVSLSSTANFLVQLGTGATPTYTTSGYISTSNNFNQSSTSSGTNNTTGFVILSGGAAAGVLSGSLVISLIDTNTWVANGVTKANTTQMQISAGDVALAATLTAVRITSTSTDTFDAGSINILYE